MSDRPSIILATSNGTGMGHLARESATALALGDRADTVLFSLSQALPLINQLGLRGEYCPSHHRKFLSAGQWQLYLADRIRALADETNADVFGFDGAWPYAGLAVARTLLPHVAFGWIRRGMWQPGRNERALAHRRIFDLVLEPGDLAHTADRGGTAGLHDAVQIPPVTLLEQVERLGRNESASRLGLDPARQTALVTLRTESLADDSAAAAAVRAVLARQAWQVALARTPLTAGELGVDSDRVVPLRGVFPLARYLSAFDVAVTEAGYNSFHEMLHAGLPTVLVPTSAAVTDDQLARARWAADHGLALTAPEDAPRLVADAVATLLDADTRQRLAARCAELAAPTGASAAAVALLELAKGFDRHPFSPVERVHSVRRRLRPLATSVLGTRGVALADRVLGRSPAKQSGPDGGPVVFTQDITTDALAGPQRIEHLLPGSSPGYRADREAIAHRYYGTPAAQVP
ncbi:MAG: glycosyltransferase [Haloechinothrix sp.]